MKTLHKSRELTTHRWNGGEKGQCVEPACIGKKIEALKMKHLSEVRMPKFLVLLKWVQ